VIGRLRGLFGRGGPGDEADDARIRRDGYPGRGTVIDCRPTGRSHAGRREVDLKLDVYLGRSRSFAVTIRPWVTDAELGRLETGRAVPVAADHAEPGHVVLAFDMDEPQSIAGLGPVAGGPGGPVRTPQSPPEREADR
jgi:hypothetical protein